MAYPASAFWIVDPRLAGASSDPPTRKAARFNIDRRRSRHKLVGYFRFDVSEAGRRGDWSRGDRDDLQFPLASVAAQLTTGGLKASEKTKCNCAAENLQPRVVSGTFMFPTSREFLISQR